MSETTIWNARIRKQTCQICAIFMGYRANRANHAQMQLLRCNPCPLDTTFGGYSIFMNVPVALPDMFAGEDASHCPHVQTHPWHIVPCFSGTSLSIYVRRKRYSTSGGSGTALVMDQANVLKGSYLRLGKGKWNVPTFVIDNSPYMRHARTQRKIFTPS